jgi:hypothetical protein
MMSWLFDGIGGSGFDVWVMMLNWIIMALTQD